MTKLVIVLFKLVAAVTAPAEPGKSRSSALLLPLQSDPPPRRAAIRRRRGVGAHQTARRGIESVILPPLTSVDLD